MGKLVTKNYWSKITEAALTADEPSFVAVAYFGAGGHKLLPLREGSKLVVDASIAAVSNGITNPKALRKLHTKGVEVYSIPLLHAKVFAFDSVGFVGSTNVSFNSKNRLFEANVKIRRNKTLKQIRSFVKNLSTDRLDDAALDWLDLKYKKPKKFIPSISKKLFKRLTMQIMPSDGQGYSGHQVQPTKGVWNKFFGIDINDSDLPTYRLRNIDGGDVFDRPVVKHSLVMTLDIPESEAGSILEMYYVGPDRYDYRIVTPDSSRFSKLDSQLHNTTNPDWHSGRLWLVH